MSHMAGSREIRRSRVSRHEEKSHLSRPATIAEASNTDVEVDREEEYVYDDEECGVRLLEASPQPARLNSYFESSYDGSSFPSRGRPSWKRRIKIPWLSRWLIRGRSQRKKASERPGCRSCRQRRPLGIVLNSLAIALMLLGLVEFVILATGLIGSFFPSEFESAYATRRPHRPHDALSHWPTDITADILPIHCHSHNDYWRAIPLKSAIRAGCTSVEADVWFFPEKTLDDLYVGHSRSSLTQQRTFRSLYVEPILEYLEKQNPNTTLHPSLDSPRNGIFDTNPAQSLVLLIDFKTDGPELWPVVSQQLEPLRQRQYLTYFNGTGVVDGPVTVVVTGNAPFNKVVENPRYRDMFFDAPLEILGTLASENEGSSGASSWTAYDDMEERVYLASYAGEATSGLAAGAGSSKPSNQGQGHSGAAPKNPAIYTPANSFYASVSFTKAVGHVLPFLTRDQKHRIRQQIRGAHKQGLKVRYWKTPSWPKGLRNYVWRVLVEEGVDYLNVDDLQDATQGNWGWPRRHRGWGSGRWRIW